MKGTQAPDSVVMVRPAAFGFNIQTAATNAFQFNLQSPKLSQQALVEFDQMVNTLGEHDIDVMVVYDSAQPFKPDAIYPNNWISFHADSTAVLYPMMAVNRRWERRNPVIENVRKKFKICRILDFTYFEQTEKFLEGTGSMVCDYVNEIAYSSRSARTHPEVLDEVCKHLRLKPLLFDAVDETGLPIYHTNVLMSIGSNVAVVCMEAINDKYDQELLLNSMEETRHLVIPISYAQMHAFAGNMIEVQSSSGQPYMLLSEQAMQSLMPGQIRSITRHAELLPLSIPTVEKLGGGSVRCMIAGIYNEKLCL